MIKCQATIEPDDFTELYYVTVKSECGLEERYIIPYVEAKDQDKYPHPDDYAAMTCIEQFLAKHEKEDADGVNTRS